MYTDMLVRVEYYGPPCALYVEPDITRGQETVVVGMPREHVEYESSRLQ